MRFVFVQKGERRVLFDAVKDGQNIAPKWVPPEDEQESNESRRYASCTLHMFSLCTYRRGLVADTIFLYLYAYVHWADCGRA